MTLFKRSIAAAAVALCATTYRTTAVAAVPHSCHTCLSADMCPDAGTLNALCEVMDEGTGFCPRFHSCTEAGWCGPNTFLIECRPAQ